MRKQLSFSMIQQVDKENSQVFNHSHHKATLNYLEVKIDKKSAFIKLLSEAFDMPVREVEELVDNRTLIRAVYSKKKRVRRKYEKMVIRTMVQRLLEIRKNIEKENRKLAAVLEKDDICRTCQRKETCWCTMCTGYKYYIAW